MNLTAMVSFVASTHPKQTILSHNVITASCKIKKKNHTNQTWNIS